LPLASAAYDENGVLYAATFDSSDMSSALYTVDESAWTVTEVGPASIGYMDLTGAPNLGDKLVACYGPYLVIVDKITGDYDGVLNLSSFLNGNNIVGVAYAESFLNTYYNLPVDWFYLIDNAGNLYETGLIAIDGSISRFNVYNDGNLGFNCDLPYFQSLYCDGVNLFWSCFNQSANKVDVIMVDFESGGMIYNTGSFADGVWPVGGIYEQGVIPTVIEPENIHSTEQIDPNGIYLTEIEPVFGKAPAPAEEPVEEPVDEEEEGFIEVVDDDNSGQIGGSLTAARVEAAVGGAEVEKISTEVVVTVTADELMYNGKIEVNFDPTTVKLVEAIPATQYTGILDRSEDLGRYVLAWVDLNGIQTDGLILTLKFSAESEGTVTITTWEENFKDSDTELGGMPREELVFLGASSVPEDHEHVYTFAKWNWAEDFSTAAAIFSCAQDGASKSYEAEVTKEVKDATCTETGLITYTATVIVDGQTYTDVKEVEIKALGHEYGEPEWTWTENFTAEALFTCKRGDDEQTVAATVTSETTEATCEEAGKTVYTATVEFEGKTYTDVKEVEIEALGHDWGEPTWTWADDNKTAEATFTCKRDETHSTTLKAEITAESKDGVVTFTATVELDGQTYTDVKEGKASATIGGATLTLGDVFSVRIYILPSEELLADEGAYVTLNGKKIALTDGVQTKKGNDTFYGFSYDIGAKMLNDDVTLKVFDGEDNELLLVQKTGEVLLDGYIYCAQTYINKNASSSNEKLADLLKALNDLGHFAQIYFKYNTENISPLMGDCSGVTAADVAEYTVTVETLNEDVIKYSATSVLLPTEIKIRQYYELGEGVDASTLTFCIDGVEVEPVVKGTTVTVTSKNVPAKSFDKAYTFEVKDAEGNVILQSQYCVFSYVNAVFEKAADNENLLNLAKALYVYGNAAKAYFAK